MKLETWEDITALMGIVGAICTALGILGTLAYNRFKNRREAEAADDAAADRLIALIKEEAEKLVAIAKLDFDKQIAEMKLQHSNELTLLREDFERQIAELKRDAENYACHVPDCPNRRVHPSRRRKAPDTRPGGTD